MKKIIYIFFMFPISAFAQSKMSDFKKNSLQNVLMLHEKKTIDTIEKYENKQIKEINVYCNCAANLNKVKVYGNFIVYVFLSKREY